MIPISSKKVTVIIAHRGPENHLKDTFLDLKHWFENIVVVGLESLKFSQIIKDHGGSWINNNSPKVSKNQHEQNRCSVLPEKYNDSQGNHPPKIVYYKCRSFSH